VGVFVVIGAAVGLFETGAFEDGFPVGVFVVIGAAVGVLETGAFEDGFPVGIFVVIGTTVEGLKVAPITVRNEPVGERVLGIHCE